MKIPENCGVCVGWCFCGKETKYKSEKCLNFHNALESKLHTPNTTKAEIKPCENDNCVNYSEDYDYNCCYFMDCKGRV